MLVREAMTAVALTVGPQHTLRQTARLMSARKVGSAIVVDPDGPGLGIITERDVLYAIGAGLDPDVELEIHVGDQDRPILGPGDLWGQDRPI